MRTQNKKAEINFFNQQAEENLKTLVSEAKIIGDILLAAPFLKKKQEALKILDAGCGRGVSTIKLANLGHKMTGIDISPKQVKSVIRKGHPNIKVIVGDLENQNLLEKGTFDVIFCSFVLHHFPSLPKIIKNFRYWLKPSGAFFLVEPNDSNIFNPLALVLVNFLSVFFPKLGPRSGTINEVYHSYGEYKTILEKNSFQITFCKTISPFFFTEEKGLRSVLIFIREMIYQITRLLPSPYGGRILILEAKKR